jgi:hypothetical protein
MREDYLVVGVRAMMIGAGAAAYGLTFQGDLTRYDRVEQTEKHWTITGSIVGEGWNQ